MSAANGHFGLLLAQPTGGGGPSLPTDAVSLLYFDGSNGATTFTDEAGLLSWTAAGNAQISTSSPITGSGSLLLDGTGDYIYSDSQTALDFGTGDYCVEGFAEFDTLGNTGLFHIHPTMPPPDTTTGVALAYYHPTASMILYRGDGGNSSFSVSVSTGVAKHFAAYRVGGTLYVAYDGTVLGSVANSTNINTTKMGIGIYFSSSYCHDGKIDAVLVTKGSSPYGASNFTPPTPPY